VNPWFKIAGTALLLATLAGCGAIMVQPQAELPPPLIDQLPQVVGVYFPAEFRDYTHKERRNGVDYEILLGPAHVARLSRLLRAMFAKVVEVGDPVAALSVDPDIKLVLVPRFEDYAFLTPHDMAGDYYTVTIRYRFDLYDPQGQRVDGYVFTGYGRQKSAAMSNTEPLVKATERAMRDAGAKLAIELTEQDSVRRLLAGEKVGPREDEEQEIQQALGSFGDDKSAAPSSPAPDDAAPETSTDASEPPTDAPEPPPEAAPDGEASETPVPVPVPVPAEPVSGDSPQTKP